ncbi:MAG: hypothetical protein K6B43_14115 [Treponema sp.]|nr:hypothetical protein [Treponema sp.]
MKKQLVSITLDIQDLIKNYPPEYSCDNKKTKFEETFAIHKNQTGKIGVSRWKFSDDGQKLVKNDLLVKFRDEYFSYDDADTADTKVYYLNYADPNLFGYYDSDLFAQDEIQTLEHPLLGSVMEYIDKNETAELVSLTEEKGEPTPYIVEGAPYWLKVVTNPTLPTGETLNLYGRNFCRASKEILDIAVKAIKEERANNIIALAAPALGSGEYKRKQIEQILKAVIASFSAAIALADKKKCVIHTGNWGAGAFGNNRELIYLAQLVGASVAGGAELVFHAIDEGDFAVAKKKFDGWKGSADFAECVDFFVNQHYHWASGDGN